MEINSLLLAASGLNFACGGRVCALSRLSLATFRYLERTLRDLRSANGTSCDSDPIVDHTVFVKPRAEARASTAVKLAPFAGRASAVMTFSTSPRLRPAIMPETSIAL